MGSTFLFDCNSLESFFTCKKYLFYQFVIKRASKLIRDQVYLGKEFLRMLIMIAIFLKVDAEWSPYTYLCKYILRKKRFINVAVKVLTA